MHLPRDALREALDRKFARVVVGMPWEGTQPGQRRHVEDYPPSPVQVLPHRSDGMRRHARRTEEQRLHLPVRLLFRCRLGVARKGVARIVDNNVRVEKFTVAEVLRGGSKRGVDGFGRRHIQGQSEDIRVIVRQVCQVGWVTRSGDKAMPGLASHEGREGATDPR
ncbi:hypothetical protein VTI28DRAFT_5681 [Corynascus sepedonium]